jgi:hypothetical protein
MRQEDTLMFASRLITRVLLLLMCAVPFTQAVATDKNTPAGFIARIDGSCSIQRGKNSIPATAMELVFKGDVVSIPKNAVMQINFLPGTGYEIRGEAKFTVSEKPVYLKGKSLKAVSIDRRDCIAAVDVLRETSGSEGSVFKTGSIGERSGAYRLRGIDADKKMILIQPKILLSKPLFVWTRVSSAYEYELTVRNGMNILWSKKVSDNFVSYPPEGKPLAGCDDLSIEIRAYSESGRELGMNKNEFSLYSSSINDSFMKKEIEINAIKDDSLRMMSAARLYESYGLIPLAIDCYNRFSNHANDKLLNRKISDLRALME